MTLINILKKDLVLRQFSEPQFNPKLINMIAKSTGAKTGILDPLGSSYKPGKDLYFNLINDLYENLNKC